jgi:hypothetical protein
MRAFWIILLALPGLAHAAATIATATIVDGSPLMIRASTKLTLAEGTRLAAEDIVETGSARHLRLEFADGLLLDLGPATRVQLQPRLAGEAARRGARLYLLSGWVKLSVPAKAAGALPVPLLASAAIDLQRTTRSVVLGIDGAEVTVFAESGETTLAERRTDAPPASVRLNDGAFYARSGAAAGEVVASPRPGFIARVPKPFLDTLPARAALFRDKEAASSSGGALVYADVQAWIDTEPALRRGFVTRWRALARQGEFRKGLEQGLAAHPEWDRVLYPERYLPASSPAPITLPTSPGRHANPSYSRP